MITKPCVVSLDLENDTKDKIEWAETNNAADKIE